MLISARDRAQLFTSYSSVYLVSYLLRELWSITIGYKYKGEKYYFKVKLFYFQLLDLHLTMVDYRSLNQ